jgi:hypothetical protein
VGTLNTYLVNSNGKGANAFSETFHGLRRTAEGLLYYNLRDKNVGTFSNDGGTTQIANDDDYVTVVEESTFVSPTILIISPSSKLIGLSNTKVFSTGILKDLPT